MVQGSGQPAAVRGKLVKLGHGQTQANGLARGDVQHIARHPRRDDAKGAQPDMGESVRAKPFNHLDHALKMALPGGQKLHLLRPKADMGKGGRNWPGELSPAAIGKDKGRPVRADNLSKNS